MTPQPTAFGAANNTDPNINSLPLNPSRPPAYVPVLCNGHARIDVWREAARFLKIYSGVYVSCMAIWRMSICSSTDVGTCVG